MCLGSIQQRIVDVSRFAIAESNIRRWQPDDARMMLVMLVMHLLFWRWQPDDARMMLVMLVMAALAE